MNYYDSREHITYIFDESKIPLETFAEYSIRIKQANLKDIKDFNHLSDSGMKMSIVEDKLHRINGPALEWPDGTKEWWLNDVKYSFQEWLEKSPALDEEKVALKLRYSDEYL